MTTTITLRDTADITSPSIDYLVTFDASNPGLAAGAFKLVSDGFTGASITGVTAVSGSNNTQYTVTVGTGAGTGTLELIYKGGFQAAAPVPVLGDPNYIVGSNSNDVGVTESMVLTDLGVFVSKPLTQLGAIGDGRLIIGGIYNFAGDEGPSGQVTAADVNGDGTPDIIVTNTESGSVYVLLNRSGSIYTGGLVGTAFFEGFSTIVNGFTGAQPSSVTTGDLNGDGKADIITANLDGTVSVLLNSGPGLVLTRTNTGAPDLIGASFLPAHAFAAGIDPAGITTADLNGDHRLDIIVGSSTDSRLSVLLGNGDGTYQAPQTFGTGVAPKNVVATDLNGDGKIDLVTANAGSATLSVLLGNGNGTFQAQQTYAVGNDPEDVKAVDLNGDGKLDLVAANFGSKTISVLRGNGDGTFEAQQTTAVSGSPADLGTADLNGDGKLDLIVNRISTADFGGITLNTGGQIAVMLGNGDGTFLPDDALLPRPVSVASGDVNGDGKADLFVSDPISNTLNVHLGNGDGTFHMLGTISDLPIPFETLLVDVNGDGKLDLITTNFSITVSLGNGDGTFTPGDSYNVFNFVNNVQAVDIDGDGKLDIAVSARFSSWLKGNGDGTFSLASSAFTGVTTDFAVAADVNGDGRQDFIAFERGGAIYTNINDGTPRLFHQILVADTTVSFADIMRVGDFNGDGFADVVLHSRGANELTLMIGNGDGQFQPDQTIAVSHVPSDALIADVDGDGKLDLITANASSDTVSVLLGNGDGTFEAERNFAVGHAPVDLAISDVNGDGRPDILVANKLDGTVSVLLNQFASASRITGTPGNDPHLDGGAGNDVIHGLAGNDVLTGNFGNDTLFGNADIFAQESDTLSGGPGDDTLYGEFTDTIDGGAGYDTLYAHNSYDWTIDLAATHIEQFFADWGNDHIDAALSPHGVTVYASGSNDTVIGSDDHAIGDTIWLGVGNDIAHGNSGDDVIVGEAGSDQLFGEAGNDSLYVDNQDTFDGGIGADAVYIAGGSGMTIDLAATNVEWVADFAGGDDILNGAGLTVDMTAYAGAGTDTITGGAGNDFLWGEAGSDTITGGIGDDVLVGGTGADTLDGGTGTDVLYGNSGSCGDGVRDTFVIGANSGVDFIYDFEHGIDKLDLSARGTDFGSLNIVNEGGNAHISFGTDTIVVVGMGDTLSASDFLF